MDAEANGPPFSPPLNFVQNIVFRVQSAFRVLRDRNYRFFLCGQGIFMAGTWVSGIATSWLIYGLTGSASLLGMSAFAGQLPSLLLTPFAGVLADRMDRRRLLIIAHAAGSVQ